MGLGLDSFLGHGEGGGRRKFLSKWKDDGKIIIYVHTRADIAYPIWSHSFNMLDTVKDKDDPEKEIEILRWVRFTSPDPEPIHLSQFFRDQKTDRLKLPPINDPFLKVREWLRHETPDLSEDTVVFEWENPKDGAKIRWRKGHLTRMLDRGKQFFGSSVDTKLEYAFVVVDANKPGDGAQIAREARSLGDSMKLLIKNERASNGDEEGNPQMHPYGIMWTYNKDADPAKQYVASRFNKAKMTDAIHEAITSSEFPDPSVDQKPRPGDKEKIRAAFEAATRIELPWDHLFPKSWKDERDEATSFDFGANVEETPKRTHEVTTKPQTQTQASPKPQTTTTAQTTTTSAPATSGPQTRRKKVEPPPQPQEELIPCDDCGHLMSPRATKCPKCGAEYVVEGSDPEPAKPQAQVKPTTTTKATTAPKTSSSGAPMADKCWSCGSKNLDENGKCLDCGMDLTDDIPFG